MVDPIRYVSLRPVLQDWCNKGRDMWYPVWGMVHIADYLLLNAHLVAVASFFSRYLNDPLPYV